MLSVRIKDVFATKSVSAAGHDGLLPGNVSFLLLQVNAMAIAAGYSSCVSFLTFKFINIILPRCASSEEEQIGRDASQHNEKYLKGNIADSYNGDWRSSLTT
jgi:ammonium transporter, Amt family